MIKCVLMVLSACIPFVSKASERLIAFPPGNLACSIAILPHDAPAPLPNDGSAASAGVPQKAEIARTGNLVCIKVTSSDDKTTEYWKPGKLELTFFLEPGSRKLKVRRGNDLLPPIFNLDRNREWFGWIDAGSLKEEEVSYRGTKCRRYEKTITISLGEDDNHPQTALYQAWIDAATLRPVVFDDGDTRYEITFLGPPVEQTLPPLVQQELKEYEALLSPAKRR